MQRPRGGSCARTGVRAAAINSSHEPRVSSWSSTLTRAPQLPPIMRPAAALPAPQQHGSQEHEVIDLASSSEEDGVPAHASAPLETRRPRARPAAAHKRLRAPGTRAQLLDKGRACAADPPWACRGCTLLNRPERTRCEACGADCTGPAGSASAACGGDAGAAAAHVASAAAQLAAGGRDADAAMAARLQREEDARGRAGAPPGWRR